MKVIGERVLVEQIATRKKSNIISKNGDKVNPDTWVIVNKILSVGSVIKNPEIKVGETPVFGEFTNFGNVKIIIRTKEKVVSHIIVHYNDIVGVDELHIPAV